MKYGHLIQGSIGRLGAATAAFAFCVAVHAAAPAPVTLAGDRAFPESITSTSDGTLYIGSLALGGVYKAEPGASTVTVFIKSGDFNTASVFGVLADELGGMLWVCSNDMSARGIPAAPKSSSPNMLKGFDLRTGEGKVSIALPDQPALCNDMAVGPDGALYITNTLTPQILKLARGKSELERWLTDPIFQPASGGGLDGIAFGGDGNLYVNTYGGGELFRVAVKHGNAGAVTRLTLSSPLKNPDALRPVGGMQFLMIEGSGQLDLVKIAGDKATIVKLKDGLHGPTGVTVTRRTAWIVEGQLNYLFDPSMADQKPLPFIAQPVPLTH